MTANPPSAMVADGSEIKTLMRAHTLDQRRRGLQETSIAVRSNLLRSFNTWMGGPGILAATPDDIERFLDSRHISPRSRAGYLSNLSVFYQWSVLVGHIDRDPTVHIVRPRIGRGLPRPISDSDLDLALRMSGGQLRAVIALAAFEGMRCVEISRLTRDDILDERHPPVLVARGKGDKPRPIPLHEQVWRALMFVPLPKAGPVLHAADGRPYRPWEISHMGNEHLHGLGIDATLHQCRHWFGTETYRTSGRNLLMVRDLMGHESVETTRIYAAYDRAGAAEAVAALEVRPSQPRDLV